MIELYIIVGTSQQHEYLIFSFTLCFFNVCYLNFITDAITHRFTVGSSTGYLLLVHYWFTYWFVFLIATAIKKHQINTICHSFKCNGLLI